MNGFFIVDKPSGMTSQTVCTKIKHALGAKKVGHNGTLDPSATGVMIVAVNQATKLLKFLEVHDKEYLATVYFGIETDSLDMDREIIRRVPMNPSLPEIEEGMEKIKAMESQVPPLTSAVKVDGKKLYEYQREGKTIEPASRDVRLYSYEILKGPYEHDGFTALDLKVHVSKGYFIRSMARDLGNLLGGCAVIASLRRTKSGNARIEEAISLDEIDENHLISIFDFFHLPIVEIKDYMIPLVKNGITLDERQTTLHEPFYVKSKDGILAIYEEKEPLKYKPVLLFGDD